MIKCNVYISSHIIVMAVLMSMIVSVDVVTLRMVL